MDLGLKGSVIAVTGGGAGIGQGISRTCLAEGARVAILSHNSEHVQKFLAETERDGLPCELIVAELSEQDQCKKAIEHIAARYGRLDGLVNNAGRSARGEAIATTAEEFAELMNLNFIALVRCTRAAMPHLLTSRGHLVNIGSLAGKTAARYMGAYSATKYAVSAYSQQLRLELSPQGLHVLLVSPGPIARDEPRVYNAEKLAGLPPSARKPGGGVKVGLLRSDKLAAQILRACERRAPELVVPARARLIFAIAQLWPSLGDRIVRMMS